jgi:sugar lactone lactonase YvrE
MLVPTLRVDFSVGALCDFFEVPVFLLCLAVGDRYHNWSERWSLMRLTWVRIAALLMIVCAGAGRVNAQVGDVLNPATHTSASGRFVLSVEPHEPDGSGPADYRLTRDGAEVWAGERAFSLWDARVTDDGVVAGYAYEGGVFDSAMHGIGYTGLTIYLLSVDGSTLLRDDEVAQGDEVAIFQQAGSDSPHVNGLFLQPALDRFVVRLPSKSLSGELWKTYEIGPAAAGVVLSPHTPKSTRHGFDKVILAMPVSGTPLTLAHWYYYRYVDGPVSNDAGLILYDEKGKTVWTYELPNEYDRLGKDWNWQRDLVRPGIVQVSLDGLAFSFRSYSLSANVKFVIEADAASDSGWRVVEQGREPADPPVGRQAAKPGPAETVQLKSVGTIRLEVPAVEVSPIGGITDFAIDDAGNLGFVRWGGEGTVRFVRVSGDGKVLTNIAIQFPKDERASLASVVPIAGDRWIVRRPTLDKEAAVRAWWLDIKTGELEKVEDPLVAAEHVPLPTGKGGFITISQIPLHKGGGYKVNHYDGQGERIRTFTGPPITKYGSLGSPKVLTGGGIAILVTMDRSIVFLDAQDRPERTVALEDIIGHKPNYPVDLAADPDGGFVLHDFNGTPSIYRINAEDKVTAQFSPRYADGRSFRLIGGVQVAPDGTMWTSDRHALLRLDEDGVVDRILGASPDDDRLERIRTLAVAPDGTIYALNDRTAAIHVFDQTGKALSIMKPDPKDWSTDSGLGDITIDGDGNVYSKTGGRPGLRTNRGYLEFAGDGTRLGFTGLAFDEIAETWLFAPGSKRRWVIGYKAVFLVDANGALIRTIRKRPDGTWLTNMMGAAVGPDGSLVLRNSSGRFEFDRRTVLSLYGPGGEPVRSIPLVNPTWNAEVAFDGTTIATISGGTVYLYDVAGGPVKKFDLPFVDAEKSYWVPFFSPDGTELWLWPAGSLELVRFKL